MPALLVQGKSAISSVCCKVPAIRTALNSASFFLVIYAYLFYIIEQ